MHVCLIRNFTVYVNKIYALILRVLSCQGSFGIWNVPHMNDVYIRTRDKSQTYSRSLFYIYRQKESDDIELEDLKVLRRSPDLLNNVKIGQGQLQL